MTLSHALSLTMTLMLYDGATIGHLSWNSPLF